MLAWSLAATGWLCALVMAHYARAWKREAFTRSTPFVALVEHQQPAAARSPQMYLYACSEALGVSTQTLKDLGFTVGGDGPYSLIPPFVHPALEASAREAMGEIATEARAYGNKVHVPATSWRWIARVAEQWANRAKS